MDVDDECFVMCNEAAQNIWA